MHLFFWILAALIIYTYFGYPLLLALASKGRRDSEPPSRSVTHGPLPKVALLIAARNEEDIIAKKIENSLALEYPRDLLDIVVVSDGSTDRTDEITGRYSGTGVRLLGIEGGRGKTIARNIAVSRTDADIIVFSDANAMYAADAIRKLVRHFEDPGVGAVCGNLKLLGKEGRENVYWKYEKWIKMLEDRTHSIIGANGSIYSIRRELYKPLPPEIDDDFIEPLLCYMDGFKLRYEPEAVSVEEDIPTENLRDEFRAKKRVVLRGMQSMARVLTLLNPLRFPFLSFALVSHKILKWGMPFIIMGLFLDNILLIHELFFELTFALQLLFVAAAALGFFYRVKLLRVPAFFIVTNLAVLSAVISFLTGHRNTAW